MLYPIYNLIFMKIIGENDLYFLGEYSEECGRVYIPTLDKSFAKDEVVFCGHLTDEYVMSVKSTSKKVIYKEDDDGLPYCQSRKKLSKSDIRKIEIFKNMPKTPSKGQGRFYR